MKKVRENWEKWDKVWKEEKEKVRGKLESIEKRQSETEGERKREMKQLEERVRTLELRNVREGEVWVGRDRLWINGELGCWDEDLDELREGGRGITKEKRKRREGKRGGGG